MGIRTAIVGYGGMGSWHAESIAKITELTVCGVYDINPEKIRKAEAAGLRGYDSLEAVLADTTVEVVLIATQNNFHMEIAIAAMEAGKHVICEKPVMMNAAELEAVMAVAGKTGKLFSIHQNRRWDKDYRIVCEAIRQDMIGKPFYIESRVQGSRGIPGDWRCVREAGGGMMLDWGVHLIDQLVQLNDSPVTEVYAHMLSVRFPDIDDNFKLMMKFENGLSALVEVDTCTFVNLPRWHVSGDMGTMVVENWDCKGKVVKASTVEFKWEEGRVYTSAGPTKTMAPRPVETIAEYPLPVIPEPDCKDYYRNYAAAVQGRENLLVTAEQALRVMKIIDAAFLSSETGTCIQGPF